MSGNNYNYNNNNNNNNSNSNNLAASYTNNSSSSSTANTPPSSNKGFKRRQQKKVSRKDQGPIPASLTVNGTTPSGKPRLYVCSSCTRAFARQEHLKRHERSHTQEKPFVCGVCERAFSRRDLLLRHAQKLHAGCADAITRLRKKSVRKKSTASTSSSINDAKITITNTISNEINDGSNTESLFPQNDMQNLIHHQHQQQNGDLNDKHLQDGHQIHHPVKRRASFSAVSSANYAMPIPDISYAENVEFGTPDLVPSEPAWLKNIDLNSIPEFDLLNFGHNIGGIEGPGNGGVVAMNKFDQLGGGNSGNNSGNNYNTDSTSIKPLGIQLLSQRPSSNSIHTINNNGTLKNGKKNNSINSISNSNSNNNESNNNNTHSNLEGYSFYQDADGPPVVESLFSSNNNYFKKNYTLNKNNAVNKLRNDFSPSFAPVNNNQNIKNRSTSNVDIQTKDTIDRNFNEIEELTDLNIPKMYDDPAGYSFYGNADQMQINSSSASARSSSNATISPILLDSNNNSNINNKSSPPQRVLIQTANTFSSMLNLEKYSRVMLFSPILRSHINHTLNNYPFVGVKIPTLPSNEKLNIYTKNFMERFLNHYPFIHKEMLNEYSLMRSTLDEVNRDFKNGDGNNNQNHNDNCNYNVNNGTSPRMSQVELDNLRASITCLPLLVATIGALVSNEKADANSLYEVSRRCIHVYLDTRKKKSSELNPTTTGIGNNDASPLWLVQSLSLSVIYGLFADDEISINVVIRQINALTALIKSSSMTKIQWDYSSILSGLNSENNEEYYYSFIKYESAVRTVHTVFHVVVLLSSLYNIAPSLKIEDMQLDLPNTSVLWNTGNFGEFRSFYNGFAFKPENFQSCLKRLVNLNLQKVELNEPEDGLNEVGGFFFKHHVSDYGLICLQNGLHQMFYYQKLYGTNGSQNITRQNSMNNTFGEPDNNNSYSALEDNFINIAKCWNLMVDQCQLYSSDKEIIIDSKVMNYHLLLKNSLFEINTKFKNNKTFELRLHKLKERVWLKDWHKMSEIFVEDNNDNTNDFLFGFSNDNEKSQEDDSELDDMITEMVQYCILILKEIFFRNNLPTRQEHENINFPAYLQNNRQILRNEIETLLSSLETNLSSASVDDLICNHLLLIKLASLNYQILFDVCIVISKFIRNFEKKYYYDNLKALRYSHSPGVHNDLISKTENGVNKNVIPINEKLFSVYKQLFKIIVIFENYLRLKYDYDNNKEDDDNFNFSNLNLNGDSVKEAQKLNLQQHHNQMNFLFKHDNDNNDMFTGFTYDQSNPPILTSNRNINTSPDELLAQNRSFELLKNLISCKKINNFLIIFKFIFKFIFYENLNYKISCFKNLNNGLDYLNKSLA